MTAPARALYPRLLGPAWDRLDPAVRRAHLLDGTLAVRGRFRIWCAPGRLARVLCRLVRLPPAGADIETRLVVTGDGDRERWERSFGGHRLVSEERAASNGQLIEWMPPVELRFRLEAEAGALRFRQAGAALRLGRLRLPLPAAVAPRVDAREAPAGDGGAVRVTVAVRAPLVGRLFEYEGVVEPVEDAP
jgi:hypothetical protein